MPEDGSVLGTNGLFPRRSITVTLIIKTMSFLVYVLESEKNKRRYVGNTQNLLRRLEQHNAGRCRSTKAYKPWKIVYREMFRSRSAAVKRERTLKSRYGRKILKALIDDGR